MRHDQQVDDNMGKQFAWIEQKAVERGIHVELLCEIDDVPAMAVLKAAKLTGCDLIVMASQGRQDPHRLTTIGKPTRSLHIRTFPSWWFNSLLSRGSLA